MLETLQLVSAFDRLAAAGHRAVLATVIHVRGSTYRLPGTRMLLADDGAVTGLVSGGCLEADLLEHSQPVLQSGQSTTVHYDYTAPDDIVWGLGLGCAGVVDILLECVDRERHGPFELLRRCMQERRPGFMATKVAADGRLAGRWLQFPDGTGLAVDWTEAEPGFSALETRRTAGSPHEPPRVVYERVDPRLRLVIFGAGPDIPPLAAMADALGWQVEVYDHRPAYLRADKFPAAVVPQLCRPEEAVQSVVPDQRTAVLLMTHHYPSDRVLLQSYAGSAARYIGALGPRRRTEMMLGEIEADEPALTEKLYAPTGLDIGAETPEDIALAIVAEIQSVFSDRQGGFLRSRSEPIHERRD